jgi:serine/threonine-protein kinase RsbW
MGAVDPTPSPSDNGAVTLTIGSRLELLSLVHALIGAMARYHEWDERITDDLTMAVIEAGTNAIQHGNVFASDKKVMFVFRASADEVSVRVDDYGTGFDPSKIANPTDPSNLLDPHGRGLYLMRVLVDEVAFETRTDQGTTVRLRKRLRADAR